MTSPHQPAAPRHAAQPMGGCAQFGVGLVLPFLAVIVVVVTLGMVLAIVSTDNNRAWVDTAFNVAMVLLWLGLVGAWAVWFWRRGERLVLPGLIISSILVILMGTCTVTTLTAQQRRRAQRQAEQQAAAAAAARAIEATVAPASTAP